MMSMHTVALQVGEAFVALGRARGADDQFFDHFWRYPGPFTTLQVLDGIMGAYRLSGLHLPEAGWTDRLYSMVMPRGHLAHNVGALLVNTARRKSVPLGALAYIATPDGLSALEQVFTRAYDHYLGWDNRLPIGRETVDRIMIDCDYDVPIEKLARRYSQGIGKAHALTCNFPPPRTGRSVIAVTVVGFGRRINSHDSEKWFAARGERPAALVETLTLCKAHPELLEEWMAIGGQPLSLGSESVLLVPYLAKSTPRGFTLHAAQYPREHGHCVYHLGVAM